MYFVKTTFILLIVLLFAIPEVCNANTVSMSSVDQVLSVLAEVVKDRAKEVAASVIMDDIKSQLCSGKTLAVALGENPDCGKGERIFFLGHKDGCREKNEKGEKNSCVSDILFEQSCRLIQDDPNIQLTDPYFLKTLSKDTVRFSIRLSTYKLNDEQFNKLNLEPFTNFVHATMEQAVSGKSNLVSFSREIDKLVDSYTVSESGYKALFSEITNTTATQTLLDKARDIVKRNQDRQVPIGASGTKKAIRELRVTDFPDLFGANRFLSNALKSPCSGSFRERTAEIEACRTAQLKLRVIAPLTKTVGGEEEARAVIRQIFYIIYESDIYKDAHVSAEFDDFTAAVKDIIAVRVNKEWAARAAMSDSLRLIASIAQALNYEQKDAMDWLKKFRDDVTDAAKKGTIESYYGLRNSSSLDWFNQNNYPPYTRRMRTNFKQMLVTPQFYLFANEQKERELVRIFDVAQRLSNVTILLTLEKDIKPSNSDMLMQVRMVVNQIAEIMKETNNPGDVSEALETFADILQHAEERNWVAIALDISERLRERDVKVEYQRSLQFSRTLLSMYQADSPEDAKSTFEATLENVSSRAQRFDRSTIDIAALAGVRAGYIRQDWNGDLSGNDSHGFGYGLFAPFGFQWAYKEIGVMLYPFDLGGYLSGTNADKSPDVRVQSALHTGLAVYWRPWNRNPLVTGISADMKPRFGSDDSRESRISWFLALELPLFIIK